MWVLGIRLSARLGKCFHQLSYLACLGKRLLLLLLKPVSSRDFDLGHIYSEFCEFMVEAVAACLGGLGAHSF